MDKTKKIVGFAVLVATALALSIVLTRHFTWPSFSSAPALTVSQDVAAPTPEQPVEKPAATSGMFRRWRSK